ncbi:MULTISPECIES: restriction endonuclease subunit S [Aeromonas]|uniref:restriction endonuclease subunit S n=1 Tax=Aeromonas TaxID=642 RepID=UPI001C2373F1|nr:MULTISPECIES: restriction endonuclease subunit S [Aeromonas]QXC00514.1 restriction endonuclease subunit S [Aeromonas sp. FDAARGOS 1418]
MSSEAHQADLATIYPRGFSLKTDWQWSLVPARSLVRLNYGRALKADVRRLGNVPVYGTNGQCGWHDTPLAKGPGLILGRKGQGPLGVEWCKEDFWVIDTAYFVSTLRPDVDLKYIYHLTKYVGLNHLKDGTSNPSLSRDVFGAQLLPLPSLAKQKEIVDVLAAYDDRIALLRETNTTLEAIAQALFKSWFVDFDPVHARARGEEPAGLAPEVAALFPDSFEESELGMVPNGWKLVPFGELLSHTIGGDWGDEAQNDKNDTQVAIIRGTDMPDLQSGMTGRVPVRYTSQKKLASRKLQDGDLVLEVSGGSKEQPTGRSLYMTNGLLEQFDCPVEPASFCRLLRPASHDVGVLLSQHMTYIYADGKTWQYQNQSTGIANFQTTHFLETELVAVPTDDVLKSFAEIVRSMIDRSHLTQIAQLATLRDTLLPRLISGQQRLPEAEAMVREVQE